MSMIKTSLNYVKVPFNFPPKVKTYDASCFVCERVKCIRRQKEDVLVRINIVQY